ncbi:acyl carrier protein [Niveispirillum sp. KHB5.9]|uniref:acyl carrier protein n=1 Tax=Niveispirillum sp. KHB5.9 TaxID=3400269 RepID=UPI003A881E96
MQTPDKVAIGLWLASYLGDKVGNRPVSPSHLIQADLGLDSLDSVELAMALEEEFRIDIPDDEWEDGPDRTVDDVVELVAAKLAAKGGGHVTA